MELTFLQFLIVCPLVFCAGFVDAVAGGGGLISLPAYLIAGLPVHFAIGTNKISSCMGTALTTVKYAKNGYLPWKLAPFCAACALGGSSLGAALALRINDHTFKIIMLVILPLTALYVLRGKALTAEKEPLPFGKTLLLASLISFVIGMYDGFYGPGTGIFLILLLTAWGHLTLKEANGLSKVINLSTNVAAVAVYASNGKILLPLGLAAGIFSLLGNYIGARCFESKGARSVKPLMLLVLVIFFVKVLTEVLQG